MRCTLLCRRSSDAGQAIHPETAQQNQKPAQIPEGAKLVDNHAKPKASTSASATAATGEPAPASGAALPKASVTPDVQSADEPAKGVATKPTQGLQASEPVKTLPHDSDSAAKLPAAPPASGAALPKATFISDAQAAAEPTKSVATKPTQGLQASEPVKALPRESSSDSNARIPAARSGQANGDAAKVDGIDEGAAAPPTPAKTTINQPLQPEASHTPQKKAHHKGKVSCLPHTIRSPVCTALGEQQIFQWPTLRTTCRVLQASVHVHSQSSSVLTTHGLHNYAICTRQVSPRRTLELQLDNLARWRLSPLLAPQCHCPKQPTLPESQPVIKEQRMFTLQEQVRRFPLHLAALKISA